MQRGPRCAQNDLCLPCGFAHDSARSAPAAGAEVGEREAHLAIALENPKPRPVLPLPTPERSQNISPRLLGEAQQHQLFAQRKVRGVVLRAEDTCTLGSVTDRIVCASMQTCTSLIGMAGRHRGGGAHQACQQVYCLSNQGCELERAPPLCQRWEDPPAIRCCPPSEWLRWLAKRRVLALAPCLVKKPAVAR